MIVFEQVEQPVAEEETGLFACEGAVASAISERSLKRDRDIAQDGAFWSVLLKGEDVGGPFLVPILAIEAAHVFVVAKEQADFD